MSPFYTYTIGTYVHDAEGRATCIVHTIITKVALGCLFTPSDMWLIYVGSYLPAN